MARRPSLATVLATSALLVAIGGSALAAVAAIPQNDRFTACYQTSPNVLDRIVLLAEPGEACPATYARVTWPASAATGPQGPQGPAGPQGPPGPPGSSGQGSTGTLGTLVLQRRVHLDHLDEATVKCPFAIGRAVGFRAIAGGASGPGESYPYIDARTKRFVGWTFRLYNPPRLTFTTGFVYEGRTTKNSFPEHSHGFKISGMPRISGSTRGDMDVTVYAVCARVGR